MKFLLTICLSALVGLSAFAQNASDSTLVASDTTKVSESTLEAAHVSSDDSLKVVNAVMDSLAIEPTDSSAVANEIKKEANQQMSEQLGTSMPKDSTELANEARIKGVQLLNEQSNVNVSGVPTDSASVANEIKAQTKHAIDNNVGIDIPDVPTDSTANEKMKEEAVKQGENYIKDTNQFKAVEGEDGDLGLPEELPIGKDQLEARKTMKKNMAGKAKEMLGKNMSQLNEAQSSMAKLKKKYSSVPNSNDLSTATKRSSLKGQPFGKRFIYGLNFNVNETNPLQIDFAPVVGWRFNTLFQAGLSGTYRAQFTDQPNDIENKPVYGYGIFANHLVFKSIFAYLEGENMSKVYGTIEENERKWKQSLLLGAGRKFRTGFLEFQLIVAYNFLHDNTESIYPNPVVFKTGFRIVR